MRYTIRSKVTHLLRTLPPNTAYSQHFDFDLLHSELLNNAHLIVCPKFVKDVNRFGFGVVAYKSIDSFDPLLQLHKPN